MTVKAFKDLEGDVVNRELCLGCGACVASCPVQCLSLRENRAALTGTCINCGICYGGCPQTASLESIKVKLFGKSGDPVIGNYLEIFSARAENQNLLQRAQDGGAVTSLLGTLLEYEFVDGAVVTGMGSERWMPAPFVATTKDELLDAAGSKYVRGPLLTGLLDAIRHFYKKKLAIVGLPCQIAAVRQMQMANPTNRQLSEAVKLCIGIFCREAFKYDFFVEVVEGQTRTPLLEIDKFDIKNGRILVYRTMKPTREIPLSVARKYVDLPCRVCMDFSAELADISIGATGAPEGHSTLIVRTESGKEALDFAIKFREVKISPMSEESIQEIRRNAEAKRESARKVIEEMKKEGRALPIWVT
ncbi:MAG: Coenzyme F420 hydrogenase/dehydrogenase, beta subunit C-terminal domain [Candidatus Hadarchaeales archaeon]